MVNILRDAKLIHTTSLDQPRQCLSRRRVHATLNCIINGVSWRTTIYLRRHFVFLCWGDQCDHKSRPKSTFYIQLYNAGYKRGVVVFLRRVFRPSHIPRFLSLSLLPHHPCYQNGQSNCINLLIISNRTALGLRRTVLGLRRIVLRSVPFNKCPHSDDYVICLFSGCMHPSFFGIQSVGQHLLRSFCRVLPRSSWLDVPSRPQ